jgi:hypothetical protein
MDSSPYSAAFPYIMVRQVWLVKSFIAWRRSNGVTEATVLLDCPGPLPQILCVRTKRGEHAVKQALMRSSETTGEVIPILIPQPDQDDEFGAGR